MTNGIRIAEAARSKEKSRPQDVVSEVTAQSGIFRTLTRFSRLNHFPTPGRHLRCHTRYNLLAHAVARA
jgi:hypothetical protein